MSLARLNDSLFRRRGEPVTLRRPELPDLDQSGVVVRRAQQPTEAGGGADLVRLGEHVAVRAADLDGPVAGEGLSQLLVPPPPGSPAGAEPVWRAISAVLPDGKGLIRLHLAG